MGGIPQAVVLQFIYRCDLISVTACYKYITDAVFHYRNYEVHPIEHSDTISYSAL